MADDYALPEFEFDEDLIQSIKDSIGSVDPENVPNTFPAKTEPSREARRKRVPRTAHTVSAEPAFVPKVEFKPAPLTKREEREVAKRLADMLTGGTGMASIVRPYLAMTDEEAEAIATPLASYLVRNEPTSGVAREILENYDLLAMTLGVGAYGVRIYHDRREELAARRPANTEALQRISEIQNAPDGRFAYEGNGPEVSIPNATRSGTSPFDL